MLPLLSRRLALSPASASCARLALPARPLAARLSSTSQLGVVNPHAKGYGRAVAQRLADRLGRSVPKPRSESGLATTALLTMGVVGLAGGVGYLSLTDHGNQLVKEAWGQLSEYGFIKEQLDPVRESLLPDFPEFPPGYKAPRTLVLDLEDTLCHMEWDRTHGWRAAKRPGVDVFLVRMAQVGYEIVLFTSGVYGFLEPTAFALDPNGCISHRLYRDSTTFTKSGERVKDLSRLNRQLKDVVVVDDDPREVQWQPENLITVPAFTNARDSQDYTLVQLIPLLEDLVIREVPDVRVELERLRALGQGDAIKGFWLEQEQRAEKQKSLGSKGIGGAIRQSQHGVFRNKPA